MSRKLLHRAIVSSVARAQIGVHSRGSAPQLASSRTTIPTTIVTTSSVSPLSTLTTTTTTTTTLNTTSSSSTFARHYRTTPTSWQSSPSSVVPEMMSTTDPRPALQQTSYNLEVPFAILDVRHGVWADVIEEVEREHSVNFGRHRNQFQKTILTVHASDDAQFEAAAEALRRLPNTE